MANPPWHECMQARSMPGMHKGTQDQMVERAHAGAGWLETLIDASRDYAVILMAPDGTISDWRGAAEHVFGYAPAEAIGAPFSTIFTLEDRQRGMDRHELALAASMGRSE